MPAISRREFIRTASSSALLGALLSTGSRTLHADPLGLPIGCQTWPVRESIAKDFPATLKQLAAAGFQTVELCSPSAMLTPDSQASANSKEPNSAPFCTTQA
jgi:hypothetical protein